MVEAMDLTNSTRPHFAQAQASTDLTPGNPAVGHHRSPPDEQTPSIALDRRVKNTLAGLPATGAERERLH